MNLRESFVPFFIALGWISRMLEQTVGVLFAFAKNKEPNVFGSALPIKA
ncbi:MAG: hypothetical protein JRJ76_15585 [Deltaproteobacteria bacterium]|nr:hypothetical protein [Deltaproteobacteria bacterium]